jgi:hypothetical protein
VTSPRSYEEVAGVGIDAQRLLLQKGDAVERVWAAWALGLALGAQSAPDLLSSLRESPAAGTRRQLLVVLAGLGEKSVLRVFAESDPDEYVRGTACQYLIQLAAHDDSDTCVLVRDCLLNDRSPIVRRTILDVAPLAFPSIQDAELKQLAQDPDLQVREASINRLFATRSPDQLFPGLLDEIIPSEVDVPFRRRLLSFCLDAGGAGYLLKLSAGIPPDRRLEILSFLVETRNRFPWESLVPFGANNQPEFDALVIALLHPASVARAAPWLVQRIARAVQLSVPRTQWDKAADAARLFAWRATELLLDASEELRTIAPAQLDHSSVSTVIAHLREAIIEFKQWRHDDEDADPIECEEAIDRRELLVRVLTDLIVAS